MPKTPIVSSLIERFIVPPFGDPPFGAANTITPKITGTFPTLEAMSDGDTLSDAVTAGSYTPTAGGTINSTTKEMQVNEGSWVAYNGATVVSGGETYSYRETVTDTNGASRVLTTPTVTVEAVVTPLYIEEGYLEPGYLAA